jgi:hypothetical protein
MSPPKPQSFGGLSTNFKSSLSPPARSFPACRSDQYLWWQVAEYTYDGFMIRSRGKGWS